MGITQKVGALGEEIALRFLMKRGYTVLHRNFWKPWGEIDIVAKSGERIHFVEVKSLSRSSVSDETVRSKDVLEPEEHVNDKKIQRLGRVVQTYLREKHVSSETPWQCDVLTVVIDGGRKEARVALIEDVTLQ